MRRFIVIILNSMLVGCTLMDERLSEQYYIQNSYFEQLSIEFTDTGTKHNLPFNEGIGQMCSIRNRSKYVENTGVINFYQGSHEKCYLFSSTGKELSNIIQSARKLNNTKHLVLLVNNTGIIAMDEQQYEQLKPTLTSHKFDPSLCK